MMSRDRGESVDVGSVLSVSAGSVTKVGSTHGSAAATAAPPSASAAAASSASQRQASSALRPRASAPTKRRPTLVSVFAEGGMGLAEVTWIVLAVVVVAVAVAVLYSTNNAFRYHARFTFYTIAALFVSSAPIPLMLPRPRSHLNARIPAWGLRQCSRVLGLRWETRGLSNAAAVDGGCVVLVNHQSALDLFVFAELWPVMGRAAVIAKKELFFLWPFGLAIWLWGTIFIDRSNKQRARSTVDAAASEVKNSKVRLFMFPEGTRNGGPELLPFKKGAFHIALDAQVPLLPVAVSRYYFLDAEKKKFDGGNIVISILPPISTKGMGPEDIDKLVTQSREVLQVEIARISEEMTTKRAVNGCPMKTE